MRQKKPTRGEVWHQAIELTPERRQAILASIRRMSGWFSASSLDAPRVRIQELQVFVREGLLDAATCGGTRLITFRKTAAFSD